MCGCYSLRCEFEFAARHSCSAWVYSFHFCKSHLHIFKKTIKERFTEYGRALLKSWHTPTKHCRFHDLSPYLTLASVSLRLHLSWTLDHVLIPVGRLKNPLLCKARGRGVWRWYGYTMVTICLHKGFRSMKAVGKPHKKSLRSWLDMKGLRLKGRTEKTWKTHHFLHLKCPGLWIWPHGSYH